jgi:hypothetical protein
MAFSAAIGTLELPTIATNYEQNSDVYSQSDIDRESESDLKRDSMEEEKQDVNVLHPSINLPPNAFPLLNSLGVQNESQMNGLLQEIVKYYGTNLGIKFMQRNNWPGFFILCPSSRSTEREAAECVIRGLYKKQEEAFTSFTLEKGLITDKEKNEYIAS